MFSILPAIDLLDGSVVRLRRGDFATATRYDLDPASLAASLAAAGVRAIHVVDLDGARAGAPRRLATVAAIVDAAGDGVEVEVGGGLRSEADVAAALSTGVARVVVGTRALDDHGFAAALVDAHGWDRVVVALDVRDGMAVGEGWRRGSGGIPVDAALERLASAGVATFEVTAIDRDGLLGGPDLALLGGLAALGAGTIVASGGVTTLADCLALRAAGCGGAIIGRAYLDGRLELPGLLAALDGPTPPGTGGAPSV